MTKNDISSKYPIFLPILNIFLDAFFLWFLENAISIFHFEYTWDIFWCIQGVEVEFITPNSTSAPCIYQKTTQIGKKWGILKKKTFQKEIFKKKFY